MVGSLPFFVGKALLAEYVSCMTKLYAALVFALLSFSAFGAVIEDPKGLLGTLDASRTKAEFADAFRAGDQVTLRIFNTDCVWGCGADGCGSMCTVVNADFEKRIAEASADRATAVVTNGTSETYDRAEYEAGGRNLLTKTLAELDVFLGMNGKVVLKSLDPIDFLLADGSKIPAFRLLAEFVAKENSMELEYQVSPRGPGLAEILFVKIGGYRGQGGEKMFKIKAIARAP